MRQLLSAWFLACFFIMPVSAQTSQPNTLEVFGTGEVASVPDLFSFNLAIEEKGQQASQLNGLINKKTQEVIQVLVDLGIDKRAIQALQVKFAPWKEYNGKQQVHKGFVLSRTVSVSVADLQKYHQAIDAILAIGINQLYGFNASSSQPKVEYQAALVLAIQNAQQQADKMAKTLDLKLGQVMAISELSSANVRPMMSQARHRSAAESFQPGEISTDAKVKVVFELIQK